VHKNQDSLAGFEVPLAMKSLPSAELRRVRVSRSAGRPASSPLLRRPYAYSAAEDKGFLASGDASAVTGQRLSATPGGTAAVASRR
jgi:hypothetical protein